MVRDSKIASMLIDSAIVQVMVPWPCPSDFGPEDRYRLDEMVSAQDRAIVYRAIDRKLSSQGFGAEVAIKILAKGESIGDEVLATRRINNPNVLRVLDRGKTGDGHQYLVAEFVEGDTLEDVAHGMSPKHAAQIMIKIARGIHAAHLAGVYHCDLKPSNIVMTSSGAPKIVDFGLARLEYKEQGPSRGNLAYMAPEQYRREEGALTPPADIYALGGLLYFLISGRIANGDSKETIESNFDNAIGPRPLNCNETLDRICARALSPQSIDRHESAAAFADDLEAWVDRRPIRWMNPSPLSRARLWIARSPIRFAAISVVVLCLVGFGSYLRYSEIRLAQQKFEAESKALTEVTQENEQLKEQMLGELQRATESLWLIASNDPRTIIWLKELFGHTRISLPGGQRLSDVVVAVMLKSWEEIQASERKSDVESLLAGFALSQSLLARHDLDETRRVLDEIDAEWTDRLLPGDQLAVSLDAIRDCVEALSAGQSGVSPSEVILQIRRIEWDLTGAGIQGSLPRLIRSIRTGLSEDLKRQQTRE